MPAGLSLGIAMPRRRLFSADGSTILPRFIGDASRGSSSEFEASADAPAVSASYGHARFAISRFELAASLACRSSLARRWRTPAWLSATLDFALIGDFKRRARRLSATARGSPNGADGHMHESICRLDTAA